MTHLHVNHKAHVPCNFNSLLENKGLIQVTGCHIHLQCSNITETVPGGVVVTAD